MVQNWRENEVPFANFDSLLALLSKDESNKLDFTIDKFVNEDISGASNDIASKLVVGKLYHSKEHGIVTL
jgi:hypothetical protein